MSTATISEIARQAGVGTATVDRVLNKRPGVHAETVQKVMQVVSELGGVVPVRGRPRRGENFRFGFVLPADEQPFYELVDRQIAQSAGDLRHQRITEVTHRLEAADAAQFAAQLGRMAECDGVALLAPDAPPVKLAINELVRGGTHVVTLFSDVPGSMRETHVGADNRAAGRTAGLLLARMAGNGAGLGGRDTLLLCSQATRLAAEIDRRIGFAQVLEERYPKLRMLRTPDLPAGGEATGRALARLLKKDNLHARVAGIYNVGHGGAGLARTLQTLELAGQVGLVVHDFTDGHRTLLGSGLLSYVLHQDIHYCVLTAARVLRALCENVRGALSVVQPRVEILTAENLA